MNKAILMGRLTRDPEIKQTQSGVPVVSFSLAIPRRFQKEQTDFINCTAWRQTAEFISKWFQKGSMIAVVGSIQTRKYTGNDGIERTATEVIADEAYFTGSKTEKTGDPLDTVNFENYSEAVVMGEDDDLPF